MAEISRRMFLKLTAGGGAGVVASMGLKTVHQLLPYVTPPEQIVPGEWTLFATTCRECPAGCGMHMRVTDGRPIKAEGNPDHSINRGGLCPRGQSAVQGLYDPDRLRAVLRRKDDKHENTSWATALEDISQRLAKARRCVVISDLQAGALAGVMTGFARAFGGQAAQFYEPLHLGALRQAHQSVFGKAVVPRYDLSQSDFIISFAADFLETWLSPVEFAWQFTKMRAYDPQTKKMGRFVYVGPRQSATAANADEFLAMPPGALHLAAAALAYRVIGKDKLPDPGPVPGLPEAKLDELAKQFKQSRGLALAGPAGAEDQAAVETATAAALLNQSAGQIGKAIDLSRPHALTGAAMNAVAGLSGDDVVIIHNVNLAYTRSGAAEQLRKAGCVVYLGQLPDETAGLADWVLPIDSPLESWGDYEPYAGIYCTMQPVLHRLWDTRPAGDILLTLAEMAGKPLTREGKPVESFEHWLHLRWEEIRGSAGGTAEEFWQQALRQGGVFDESSSGVDRGMGVSPAESPYLQGRDAPATHGQDAHATLQLWLWPAITLYDGRTANRGWIQEAPEPTSTIVWGNCVELHPATAAALGLGDTDIIEVTAPGGAKLQSPLRTTTDLAENTLAVSLGQGHWAAGLRHACGKGINAFALGRPGGLFSLPRSSIRATGKKYQPTYSSFTMEQHGRELMQWVSLSELAKLGEGQGQELRMPLPEGYDKDRDVYPPHPHRNHRWAMVVDLHRCIGCGACTVACQAENNVAVVGPEAYRQGREMAWLKIVPYRNGDNSGRLGFLPVLCQQCDAAPCEPVCPVFASVHSEEGINSQVYNRCIGTRYCSNNCPYKVRRFNWLNYTWQRPLEMQLNPDVSVRGRGVMEKCTFCIQRIREAEIRAKRERRPVADGEIQPACVQSCPTRVFTFGDLMDNDSQVSRLIAQDPRRYQLLQELNTKTAVIYLRKIGQSPEE